MSALLTYVLGAGGPENFDILQVGGPENFGWVGGFVRPPHMIVYGGNSVSGWSGKFCNSGGGWSEKRLRTPPLLTFLMEYPLAFGSIMIVSG